MAKFRVGRECILDYGKRGILKKVVKQKYKDGTHEWFAIVEILDQAWDGQNYVNCQFDMRILKERVAMA